MQQPMLIGKCQPEQSHTDKPGIIWATVINEWQRYWSSPSIEKIKPETKILYRNLYATRKRRVETNPVKNKNWSPQSDEGCNKYTQGAKDTVCIPSRLATLRKYYNKTNLITLFKETDNFSTMCNRCNVDITF